MCLDICMGACVRIKHILVSILAMFLVSNAWAASSSCSVEYDSCPIEPWDQCSIFSQAYNQWNHLAEDMSLDDGDLEQYTYELCMSFEGSEYIVPEECMSQLNLASADGCGYAVEYISAMAQTDTIQEAYELLLDWGVFCVDYDADGTIVRGGCEFDNPWDACQRYQYWSDEQTKCVDCPKPKNTDGDFVQTFSNNPENGISSCYIPADTGDVFNDVNGTYILIKECHHK